MATVVTRLCKKWASPKPTPILALLSRDNAAQISKSRTGTIKIYLLSKATAHSEAYLAGRLLPLCELEHVPGFHESFGQGQKDIFGVSIDLTVFFTILPGDLLFEVGTSSESLMAKLELE